MRLPVYFTYAIFVTADLPVPVVVVTTAEKGKNTLEKTTDTGNDNQAVVA